MLNNNHTNDETLPPPYPQTHPKLSENQPLIYHSITFAASQNPFNNINDMNLSFIYDDKLTKLQKNLVNARQRVIDSEQVFKQINELKSYAQSLMYIDYYDLPEYEKHFNLRTGGKQILNNENVMSVLKNQQYVYDTKVLVSYPKESGIMSKDKFMHHKNELKKNETIIQQSEHILLWSGNSHMDNSIINLYGEPLVLYINIENMLGMDTSKYCNTAQNQQHEPHFNWYYTYSLKIHEYNKKVIEFIDKYNYLYYRDMFKIERDNARLELLNAQQELDIFNMN